MDIVFKPMADFVLCFVDDIVIFSATMEEHIEHVARAIKHSDETGCTLDPRKLTNIQSWPIPKIDQDIQRFMGVVNYFREHVPKISTLTAPLDELRNVDKLDDEWTDMSTDAFIAIQKILTNTPILRYPNMAYPFSVATDASNVGIGAVLYQLVKKLAQATGFDHRLATPYHPRANGVAERWVQTSVRTLRKLIKGALKDWDLFVPGVQLAINGKISKA
ncbi:hypothetical protein O0I10_005401 [Lichtheimia ornata]|uniref:Reverse transcriptase domain-containing protein n=1 Tax=Lichtheimia ornata TaxID=688661 RepID=A0AAD7V495_9FUNG|nr:uncharacterized protein O0I10_005401 [Lichtheimia ornata]KAJ8659019.1 hypothetical protein O0I10_005401 [Lichtheimia ornata]